MNLKLGPITVRSWRTFYYVNVNVRVGRFEVGGVVRDHKRLEREAARMFPSAVIGEHGPEKVFDYRPWQDADRWSRGGRGS